MTVASLLWNMGLAALRTGNLPGPGIKPVSPALAGRFLTTAPPEKPLSIFWKAVINPRRPKLYVKGNKSQ